MNPESPCTVGSYLVERLEEIGLKHIFGVPGDYILEFFDLLLASKIELVGTCNELNAGYAADGYARINGVGAACVTYGVGGFSLTNAVAGAMAERIPLVVISGGPMTGRRGPDYMLHHTLPDSEAVAHALATVTLASLVLKDPARAPGQIDHAIRTCLQKRGPVYIELPTDMVNRPCQPPGPLEVRTSPVTDPQALQNAVRAITARMSKTAGSSVVWVGHEASCCKAEAGLLKLLDHLGLPVLISRQGKGAADESHPSYAGLYRGGGSHAGPGRLFESAATVLNLGVWPTSINTGGYSAALQPERMINAAMGRVELDGQVFEPVGLDELIPALLEALPAGRLDQSAFSHPLKDRPAGFDLKPEAKLSADRFFERLSYFLGPKHVVMPDTGAPMISTVEMPLAPGCGYVQQAYYLSIGYTVPAALGVALADRGRRPVVLVGDGSFQMTAQEVSSMIRLGLNPIVIVWNNDGYQVERIIHDGPFNDLQNWSYAKAPEFFGGGWGMRVTTEGELDLALTRADAEPDSLALIELVTKRWDLTQPMARAYEHMQSFKH